ncbi:MAG: hypothetical protein ABSC94_30660 [Polyangiaceae bacterium]|jgi:hypothetical protein
MNTKRIILAGLVAGLVMNVLDFITNVPLFGAGCARAYQAIGLRPSDGAIAAFWTSFDLVAGVLIAFLYAAMRPRFGAGPRTALVAAFIEWLLVHMTLASHMVDGVFPIGQLIGTAACELVSACIGGLIACALYVEPAKTAAGAASA